MSEEKKTMDKVEAIDVDFEEMDDMYPDYEEYEDESIFKKFAFGVGGSIVVGGVTALAVKNRAKIKAWKEERDIRKLEKKGYTVIPNDVIIEEPKIASIDDQDDDSEK